MFSIRFWSGVPEPVGAPRSRGGLGLAGARFTLHLCRSPFIIVFAGILIVIAKDAIIDVGWIHVQGCTLYRGNALWF